jgi:DNA polymerase (family 10)
MGGGGVWKLPRPRAKGSPHFSRNQIATVLHQVGVLLELRGANPFRTRSYFNGSRTISTLTDDFGEIVVSGRLSELKGIGKGLGSGITNAVLEGKWADDWIELFESTPAGLIEMLGIPNLGPKRIKLLNEELGITNVPELQESCEAREIEELNGFGKKSQQKILDGIQLLKRFNARRRLDIGLLYGNALKELISKIPNVEQIELAGSARRKKESIGDLDLVIGANLDYHEDISNSILSLPGIADIKGAGDSKISLILDTSIFENEFNLGTLDGGVLDAIGGEDYEKMEAAGTIDAQVRIVPPNMFPFTLAYFTGSKEHNIRLRQRALDRGLKLNEFGLIPIAEIGDLKGIEAAKYSIKADSEEDIYKNLDLPYIVPELREDLGEIEAAELDNLPDLISINSINGAFHNHTTLSDGEATLEQMADEAQKLNWKYLGISDHSESLKIANGANSNDLLKQGEKIEQYNLEWNKKGFDFRLFHGVESDILENGKLDYSDDVLQKLDYVVASVHAINKWKNRDESENTEDLIRAIENKYTTMLGHPTGRIIQGRDGYDVDMHAVLRTMGELNEKGIFKAVELNASPYRLDLDWRLCKFAKICGVPVSINPDAHDLVGLKDVRFGTHIARKGWLEKSDVLNTKSSDEVAVLFGKRM